ncbi:hypothetical protein ALC60_11283 [Trachymyrmex zeteki]|uniref:Glycoprotein n=1 Tax=Mycetomoellerius zeteki TaxID=64791 RepID=A0A151WP94_9HYME|nr:hypothetical protein ALC60_11283 [Trachymyrmex zeteki]
MESIEPKEEEMYVQLLQSSDYDKTTIIQCRMEIDKTIHYCGMHSHVSIVHNGKREYLQEIGEQGCKRLHATGTIRIANAEIDRIQQNTTNLRSITLAGSTTVDGRCSGFQYTDGYGTWDNVVVQASVRITLRTLEAPIKRTTGNIITPSGTHCRLTTGWCTDTEGMETFWAPLLIDHCHFNQYDILYEGPATKLFSRNSPITPTVYTVTTQDTTFALTKTSDFDICGYRLAQTEHPKLFILETQKGKTFGSRSKIAVDNLDIFLYVNSKFIYVEKHIKTQLTQLYRNIMEQKCALERQVLQNALTLASIAPDEMAYRITREPGYTAVTSGEVIYLIKCIPVECKMRHAEQCYNELPVTHRNTSLFLLPRSRILSRTGTQRDCNNLLPIMYKIHGGWFRMTPKPVEVLTPPIIQPLTQPAWRYIDAASLATSGIYSSEDIDRLCSHIMFPIEKPSMLNTIAKGAMGETIQPGSVYMMNLLDENSLNQIAESAGGKLWRSFVTFGSASAGVLAIFIIVRIVKLIIDTMIHGYALHTVYGWSLHLLGAVWSSVTHLLLHLGGKQREEPTAPEDDLSACHNTHLEKQAPQSASAKTSVSENVSVIVNENETKVHQISPRYSYIELRKYLKDTKHTDNAP